eukprot:TRINITY_DN16140_c0_g1_i1.p2 TRINITY_DN16140_c0_g1~~TRINITY_DN16140_c0_g1_i1.p2  ORF type:complete len:282 (+),score=64.78 TRINITY_DN16140_c0_g1_i1:103-948(+)
MAHPRGKAVKGILKKKGAPKKNRNIVFNFQQNAFIPNRIFAKEKWELEMEERFGWDYEPYKKMYFHEIDSLKADEEREEQEKEMEEYIQQQQKEALEKQRAYELQIKEEERKRAAAAQNSPPNQAPVSTKRMPTFCGRCGNKLRAGHKFCMKCGKPVVAMIVQSSPNARSQPKQSAQVASRNYSPPPNNVNISQKRPAQQSKLAPLKITSNVQAHHNRTAPVNSAGTQPKQTNEHAKQPVVLRRIKVVGGKNSALNMSDPSTTRQQKPKPRKSMGWKMNST